MLSAASCLAWLRGLIHADSEAQLVAEAQNAGDGEQQPIFLPYLSGERTPHNDPRASGVFFGLSHDTTRAELARAVLEGVAFAFADGQDALLAGGASIDRVSLVGGGSRSALWAQILADTLGRTLARHEGSEVGAALGAARLARLARGSESVAEVCFAPPLLDRFEPDATRHERLSQRLTRFRQLYRTLAPQMHAA
ncbi:MAG TPA: FGGY-family carbohydrate kinase [Polyangiaceae bacterium]|nr:FGGY-family carbohydrate kinase [Polyangiaceae bacterium]